ncbi:MAG: polysaccharide pyruvyl transferase family protein [Lachnospiraceae bacterium]|nr:polysaccharide pyruvyl transferase family protein [Lachnospiraceae bacterium]MBQ8797043.1 polysaccharide pyruvyl transferase family protein [Oscillospiraceae bacterium]
MKIGLITFHFAHNQGAVLQCYALQKALEQMGCEVKIINYCPSYHTVRYCSSPNPFIMAVQAYKKSTSRKIHLRLYQAARRFCYGVNINIKKINKQTEHNFSCFINKHLNLTKQYKTLRALSANAPDFDIYISGSDQLWNPELLDGSLDPAYFLNFGSSKTRKITYAVSLKESLTEDEKKMMGKLCEGLDAISLRERNSAADEVLGGNYTTCIDPTFLLDCESYNDVISEEVEKEPYIFVYGFQTTNEIVEAVNTISKKLGIRVINGSPNKIRLVGVEQAKDYGPDMFLSYIKNASFVVTNSFHGTAFSIIFKKQFVTIAHTTRGKRMKDILEKLGLSERLWKDSACDWEKEIDYTEADKKCACLKKHAYEYLEENIKIKA